MQAAGKDAFHFDLDNLQTFAAALAGVDRLFLPTGYTVEMLVQSKTRWPHPLRGLERLGNLRWPSGHFTAKEFQRYLVAPR